MTFREIEYVDYDGNKRKERFYFHLSKAEILRLEIAGKNGLKAMIQNLIDSGDTKEIWKTLENVITLSVGKKSVDGNRFIKTSDAKADFLESEAYSVFIFDMIDHPEKAAKFFEDLAKEADGVGAMVPESNVPAPYIV